MKCFCRDVTKRLLSGTLKQWAAQCGPKNGFGCDRQLLPLSIPAASMQHLRSPDEHKARSLLVHMIMVMNHCSLLLLRIPL